MQWPLPELATPFLIGPTLAYTRRPGFLVSLSDEQYQQSFKNLQKNPGAICLSRYV